jgi:sugar/nucleoside kinase (ribokinase family)
MAANRSETPVAPPVLVIVGAASRDRDQHDPRGWRLGGGVTYSAMAAARLGVGVRALVGVDAQASDADELERLRDAGVEVRLFALDHGPIFDNRETPVGRVQFADGPSDRIPPDALPANWQTSQAAILAPVAGELGDEWATAFGADTRIALAAQGLVRRLAPGAPVAPLPLVRTPLVERAQFIFISAEDVATGGAPPLRELLGPGQQLVLTHGGAGAVHLRRDVDGLTARYLPPLPRRTPTDTTGAGDVFLGSWVAASLLLGDEQPWRALMVAAAMASLAVEGHGLAATPTAAQLCEVLVRQREHRLG